jgi:hypothetical protein
MGFSPTTCFSLASPFYIYSLRLPTTHISVSVLTWCPISFKRENHGGSSRLCVLSPLPHTHAVRARVWGRFGQHPFFATSDGTQPPKNVNAEAQTAFSVPFLQTFLAILASLLPASCLVLLSRKQWLQDYDFSIPRVCAFDHREGRGML